VEDYKFVLKSENIQAAFNAAKNDCDGIKDMATLVDIFEHFGFEVGEGESIINKLDFCYNEKSHDTMDLIHFFDSIAPFVDVGSYIEMKSMEGTPWRWVFDGKNAVGQFPVDYIWPSQPLDKNHFLGFYQTSRQNYWKATQHFNDFEDEVIFGIHNDLGGTTCEMAVRWYVLGEHTSPRFEIFVGSILPMELHTLMRIFQTAIDIGDSNKLTPEKFCERLTWLNFKDLSDKKLK